MKNKRIFVITFVLCVLAVIFCLYLVVNKANQEKIQEKQLISEQSDKTEKNGIADKQLPKNNKTSEDNQVKTASVQIDKDYDVSKVNMYDSVPNSMLPLSAIAELAQLPQNIQNEVEKITETGSIYLVQKINDKLLLIVDNQENIRHGVDFVEISIKNGHQTKTTLGYNGKIQDSDNDKWEYDEKTNQPIKHIKYDKNGDLEFTEVWNYDSDEPVKYEMKDSEDRVISLRKEVLQDDTNLRVEHLIYDKNGNTKINVSATYEGSDLKRFTYYNADKPKESASVFSEYSDGQKTSETVYTSDFKVKNTYNAKYKDDIKESITVLDGDNNEVGKYTK